MDPTPIDVIVQAGSFGLLAVILLYGIRVLIPRVLEQFTKTLNQQRSDFREVLERERELFAELIAYEREALQNNTQAVQKLTTKVDELCKRISS